MKQEVLRMEHIYKSYGNISVLKDFKLNLFKGEILGVVGLSGSGKTTILDIVAGNESSDGGRIYINENEVKGNEKRLDVFCIQSRTMLVQPLSIAENIFVISKHKSPKFLLANSGMNSQIKEIFHKLRLNISPSKLVQNLSSSERHLVELVKAYVLNAQILIIDDIIDGYSPIELMEFKRIVGYMKSKNVSFIFLSNKIEVIQDITDRIILLDDGKNLKTFQTGQLEKEEFSKLLAGGDFNSRFEKDNCSSDEIVFSGKNLNSYRLENVSFDIKKGEIVGFFDISNKSNMNIYNILEGKKIQYEGEFYSDGKRYKAKSPNKAKKHGLGFISKNSINSDVFLNLTYLDNILLSSAKKIGLIFYFKSKLIKFIDRSYSKALNISEKDRKESARFFDIYTKQKIYLSRWDFVNLKLLLCDRPFENVDMVTKKILQEFFDSYAKKGVAVVVFSSNIESMLTICDSVFVFSSNKLKGKYTRDEILKLNDIDVLL